MLFGGMLFAVARWNSAATDRAFVEAAARAARLPPVAPLPPRYWAPTPNARPGPAATIMIETTERLRTAQQAVTPPPATGGKPAAAAP